MASLVGQPIRDLHVWCLGCLKHELLYHNVHGDVLTEDGNANYVLPYWHLMHTPACRLCHAEKHRVTYNWHTHIVSCRDLSPYTRKKSCIWHPPPIVVPPYQDRLDAAYMLGGPDAVGVFTPKYIREEEVRRRIHAVSRS